VTTSERLEPPIAVGALVIACVTAFVYWPALHGGFIFDDEALLTSNELVRAADGLRRVWLTTEAHDYWPVTNTMFWIEWRLFGLNPTGYHVINLGLHILSSVLAWRLLRLLQAPGAFLAAVIFAVHPVNVESVAWIAQRKNTASLVFMLMAAWLYEQPKLSARRDLMSVGCFVVAMLSKGSAVVLPPLLLLNAWWRRGRIDASDIRRTAPFFTIGAGLTLVNIWFQTHGGEPIRNAGVLERILGAGAALWFYWSKALLPVSLSFIYPQWTIDPARLVWWVPALGAIAVTGVAWWLRDTRIGRGLWFAWLFVAIALVPVLGFTDVYFMKYALVADHYQYIAILGISALVAGALVQFVGEPGPALQSPTSPASPKRNRSQRR